MIKEERESCFMEEKWVVSAKRADFAEIGKKFQIDPVIARIIRNRDVIGDEAVREYLYGDLTSLHDPLLLKGCREAAEILSEKIRQKKRIRIIGDYDIDGVNATYILLKGLRRAGAEVDCEIPDRMKDGFGVNSSLIALAIEEGIDTVITCDNGISALEPVRFAKENHMTVIVTDHHEPSYQTEEDASGEGPEGTARRYILPEADVIVDPKQPGCPYPEKGICGAVVAWKVMMALYALCGIPEKEAMVFLPYAAFATVGDVMDLKGENRIIVRHGLKALSSTDNTGLKALISLCGLEGQALTAYHIGFVLGPCINASGRLETARHALALLLAENMREALPLAQKLKDLNDARKKMTADGVEEACRLIEGSDLKQDRVLVVYLKDCHESVAGIIAGRLRERYYRPVFVVTKGENCAKGSARSIEGYSMFDEMVKVQDVFLKFGGHPMAAGFSLEEEKIGEMRRRLNLNCTLDDAELTPKVVIDVPMPVSYVTEGLIRQLSVLEPFGKGNEKPLFAQKDLRVLSARILGKNRNTVKMTVCDSTGCEMEAMYYGEADRFLDEMAERYGVQEKQRLLAGMTGRVTLSMVYYPQINSYMGRNTLQAVIKNYRFG